MEIVDRYLNTDNTKDGDIITILDAGVETKNPWGKPKIDFRVSHDGHEQIYTPNFSALQELSKMFGRVTEQWINQKFSVKIIPNIKSKSGKSIYPTALVSKV